MKTKYTLAVLCLTVICEVTNAQFVQEKKVSDTEAYLTFQEMQIAVTNDVTEQPVQADVKIVGLHPRNPVVFEGVTDTIFEIKNYRLYTVSCAEKGFMLYSEKFWPDQEVIHLQKVGLKPLSVGLKTDLRDITFLGNKTAIYHKSKPALDELIAWLNLNPELKIAIIGHVNGPDQTKSKKFYNKASEERAQAVIDYLVKNGIDKNRLDVKGAGNTEMLYPDPQTDWQNQANRRIEIEILSI